MISIVLPTHNGERYLAEAIESCLGQTCRAFELIVVDDASTDGTESIVQRYASDERVRYVKSPTNRRLPGALNLGFESAKGSYLTWTSDDNAYEPSALERMRAALEASPRLDVVYADCTLIDADGQLLRANHRRSPDYIIDFPVVGACFLYRRSVMQRVGRYAEDLFLAEDYDFFLRAYLCGCRMRRLDEALYRYRFHPASLGSTYGAEKVDEVAEAVRRRHLGAWRRGWLRTRRRLRQSLALVIGIPPDRASS